MFLELLSLIVDKVEGSIGACIMGMDGITVEQVCTNNPDAVERFNIVAAAHTATLRRSIRMTEEVDAGILSEVSLVSSEMMLAIKLINQEYFLLIAVHPGGNLGRARFELRKACFKIAKEFSH